jgi:hypothetical protein
MRSFDGRFANAFLPEDYSDFAAPSIRCGTNHYRRIGHGEWRAEVYVEAFGRKRVNQSYDPGI